MEQDNQNEKVTVTDNMQLSLFPFPEVPEDVIFPDELNAYLRDRVQVYMSAVGKMFMSFTKKIPFST